ncbi:MAG TPA: hypothetical protein PKJ30_00570 [Leptospiraceae bacterium]|nr:hypothetical protein [Leptospiraceae bacterium]
MSSDAKDNYDHLSLNTWYCAGEREEENEEGQFKILKWHPEDPPPPVAANSTLKSNPWFDKFFQADVDLPLKRVVTALERVRQDYFAATDPKIMIKTKEESFHDLSFSDALTFAGREAELEYFHMHHLAQDAHSILLSNGATALPELMAIFASCSATKKQIQRPQNFFSVNLTFASSTRQNS